MKKKHNLTRKERQQLNIKDARHTWYLELAIAACVGASLALAFGAVHMMLTKEWTW